MLGSITAFQLEKACLDTWSWIDNQEKELSVVLFKELAMMMLICYQNVIEKDFVIYDISVIIQICDTDVCVLDSIKEDFVYILELCEYT